METKIQMSLTCTSITKHVACNYVYKLERVDDKVSKPFNSYLGKDAVYNFIKSMVEVSKYRTNIDKELVLTKEDYEDFESSTKCWIFDNIKVESDVKVRVSKS